MINWLHLTRFKSFQDAELTLGPLTILFGTNASGKSNLRDAFRFLHGISLDYTLAEIFGEKWLGGVRQWDGIRGGTQEAAFMRQRTFAVEVKLDPRPMAGSYEMTYSIEVKPGEAGRSPLIVKESLYQDGVMLFDTHPGDKTPQQGNPQFITAHVGRKSERQKFSPHRPVLTQVMEYFGSRYETNNLNLILGASVTSSFRSIRCLHLDPDAMRTPSVPGQTIGDRGENLSSVLQAICDDLHRKTALIEWVRELTPMDVKDFEFPSDQTGKILVTLVEKNGQRVSAHSASDGTLRFLAILAALLGPGPAQFYFFEEIENGIHPARLYLLLQLLEREVVKGRIQVIASTHSPQLLSLLGVC